MGFVATKPQSDYTPPPVGMHIARCYQLIDLGTQKKTYQGQDKGEARKLRIGWELLGEDKTADGKPFSISKSYFLSLHEKAALRKDLESWRGRPFSADEENAFDVLKLMNVYCMLNVIREVGNDGNEYTKIAAITPLPKGMPKPDGVNAEFVFDLDAPDMSAFEKFSEKTKEIIEASREWRARKVGARTATVATKASGADDPFGDIDAPF